jgi:hypothetical protein
MLLRDALVDYFLGSRKFSGFGTRHLDRTYDWKLPQSTSRYMDVRPELSNYEANVLLKSALHTVWKSEPTRRLEVTRWVISDWGGIRGNSADRLSHYSLEAEKENPATPMTGIASFSKVLAIVEPDRFAILDARIVVSLTAIQVIAGVDDGVMFPYLQGRNLVTGHTARKLGFSQNPDFSQHRLLERFQEWSVATNDEAYRMYLDILQDVCTRPELKCGILPLEMALFADAERLATLCVNNSHQIGAT